MLIYTPNSATELLNRVMPALVTFKNRTLVSVGLQVRAQIMLELLLDPII